MPQTILHKGTEYSVATADELLEFVNKGREAGAAKLLTELLPSEPIHAERCLIANNLNFGCSVSCETLRSFRGRFKGAEESHGTLPKRTQDGGIWYVYLGPQTTRDQAHRLFTALDIPYFRESSYHDGNDDGWYGALPEEIGNAAELFDAGAAFQEFNAFNS